MFKEGFVKQIWQLYIVELLAGFYFPRAIVLLFLMGRGLSFADIGLTVSLIYGFNLLFEYPTGVFADRFGRKNSLMIAFVLYACASVLYGASYTLTGMLIASAIQGVAWAFQSGAREALVYDSLKKYKLEKLNKQVLGVMDALGFVGVIITTFIGQQLFQIFDGLPYLLNGGAYLTAAGVLYTVQEVRIKKSLTLTKHMWMGIRLLWQKSFLRFLIIFGSALFFFENAWYSTNQVLLVRHGLPQVWLSWFYVIAAVLGIGAGFLLPKLMNKIGNTASLVSIIVLQVLALWGVSRASPWLMMFLSYGMFLGHMWWGYVEADTMHKFIPSRIRATVLSGKQLLISLIFLFNPWVMAYTVELYNQQVFAVGAGVVVGVGVIGLWFWKHLE